MNVVKFKDLIYNVLAPLRQYAKQDVLVMQKVLLMLKYLAQQPVEKEFFKDVIEQNIQLVLEDVKATISNKKDLEVLQGVV
jgi:uncharacterized membrane protein